MFIENPSADFRQGDILEKVYFTPPIFYKTKDDQINVNQAITIRCTHLVIVSHCCELQWYEDEQGYSRPRRPFVLVAPLSLKLPFQQDTDEYRLLIENGEKRPENDPVQYFYFKSNALIGSESVIDFSSIIPIRSGTLKELGVGKVLELEIKYRHLFRTKLHEYFSRIPPEEWDEVKNLFPQDFD